MTDNTRYNARAALRPGRLALLGSVAGLGAAVLVAGPAGYLPLPGWCTAPAAGAAGVLAAPAGSLRMPVWSTAHAAGPASPAPAGFADLVTKVKPAVISVRV